MSKIVGKIIGGVAAGGFAIGGAIWTSQLDAQTDVINAKVDDMNILAEKVAEEYYCHSVTLECGLIYGTADEYEKLNTENDETLDEYNDIVDEYNKDCAGSGGIKDGDEQRCVDLNNKAAALVDNIYEQLEELDKFVEDIK